MKFTNLIPITHAPTLKAISLLRAELLGMARLDGQWYRAVKALEFAIEAHDGQMRKDGVTPYVLHPVRLARHVLTLPFLLDPVTTVCGALTHDTIEDCGVTEAELAARLDAKTARVARICSKKGKGFEVPVEAYALGLADCPCASVVKGVDRLDNHDTMPGVFSREKMLTTVTFSRDVLLPMLKSARRKFPEQQPTYENIKRGLQTQISLVLAFAGD